MSIRKPGNYMLLMFILFGLFTGCAKYATSGKMMERIEKKATAGISEKNFIEKVPIARLVREEGGEKVYQVAFGEPCLVCGSGEAFLRSFEPYATRFTFIDGTLVSTERIIDGK